MKMDYKQEMLWCTLIFGLMVLLAGIALGIKIAIARGCV